MAVKSSGALALRGDIGAEIGSSTINVSLRNMSSIAGFSIPDRMSEFYGYSRGIDDGFYLFAQSEFDMNSAGNRMLYYDPDGNVAARSINFNNSIQWWLIAPDVAEFFTRVWVDANGGADMVGRFIFTYQFGNEYRGDVQIDQVQYGEGLVEGFEQFTLWERNTTTQAGNIIPSQLTDADYDFIPVATNGARWNLRRGQTPSGGTGRQAARDGQYYAYAEASGAGTAKVFMRSPLVPFTAGSGRAGGFSLGNDIRAGQRLEIWFEKIL